MTGTIVLAAFTLVGWVAAGVLSWLLHGARKRLAWYDASTKELQQRYVDAEDEARHYREAAKVVNIHSAALEAREKEQG